MSTLIHQMALQTGVLSIFIIAVLLSLIFYIDYIDFAFITKIL